MTAMWKQSALDQAQKKAVLRNLEKVVAEQKRSLARLEAKVKDVERQRDNFREAYNSMHAQRDILEKFRERYEFLREQELMIMNKDGAQYFKGKELDKYVDEGIQNSWGRSWGSMTSNKYAQSMTQALARSMVQTKETLVEQVLNNKFAQQTPIDAQYHYAWKAYPMSFTITEESDDGNDPRG